MRRSMILVVMLAVACGKPDAKPAEPPAPSGSPVAAPPLPADRPTEAECDAAVRRIAAIVPGVAGDAVDRNDCLLMPREVVVCMTAANSEAEADACAEKFAAKAPKVVRTDEAKVGPPPDEARASAVDCRTAVANVRKLVPGMNGDDEEMVRDCAATASIDEVKCLIAAKTTEELEACDPPASPD